MIYVSIDMFLKQPEAYIDAVNKGCKVYICMKDGSELKIEKYMKNM